MKYTAHIEITFEHDVQGDIESDPYLQRNLATAAGATEARQKVLNLVATRELSDCLLQFEDAKISSWSEPESP